MADCKAPKTDVQESLFDRRTLAVNETMNRISGRLAVLRIEMHQTKASSKKLEETQRALSEDIEELEVGLSNCQEKFKHGR
jgi:chromosome segregation ATPase